MFYLLDLYCAFYYKYPFYIICVRLAGKKKEIIHFKNVPAIMDDLLVQITQKKSRKPFIKKLNLIFIYYINLTKE